MNGGPLKEASRESGGEAWWQVLLKIVTPAGVLAILAVASGIQGQLDRNCDATVDAIGGIRAVVQIDNELALPKNREIRELLLKGKLDTGELDCG